MTQSMAARKPKKAAPPSSASSRVLFSWLGFADCGSAVLDLKTQGKLSAAEVDTLFPNERQQALPEKYRARGKLKLLLDEHHFDEVHVLSDIEPTLTDTYKRWLADQGHQITIHPVTLSEPFDYEVVYRCATAQLRQYRDIPENKSKQLAYYLNPGTTAMGAVWILLSHTTFPAELFHLAGSGLSPQLAKLPFRIGGLDFLPDIDARRAAALAGLAAAAAGQDLPAIDGESEAIYKVKRLILQYASAPFDVLIHGASGSGKENVATEIVEASQRRPSKTTPFVKVNCAAFSEDLLESELFGHVRGAFTGAVSDKKGKFTEADGGTLFLDEIGECSSSMQAKLLRVLQPEDVSAPSKRKVLPVGADASNEVTVDVRVIAATNRDLRAMVDQGTFRADLYYRLATLVIRLPSLNERQEDIRIIAKALLGKANKATSTAGSAGSAKTLTESAYSTLSRVEWAGNVRQLNAVITRAVICTPGDNIDECDIRNALADDPFYSPAAQPMFGRELGEGFTLTNLLNEAENTLRRHYISRAIEQACGDRTEAATKLLGFNSVPAMRHHEVKAGLAAESTEQEPE